MNKAKQNKRAYQQIDLWKRKELIDTIVRKDETMKDAANRLNINYWTAKHIMKVYRRSGSYETDLMRKKKKREYELKEKVLHDSQFADYTQLEPSSKISISNKTIEKESTQNWTFEKNQEQMKYAQTNLNANFLFEGLNENKNLGKFNYDCEIKSLWNTLGNKIFSQYSL